MPRRNNPATRSELNKYEPLARELHSLWVRFYGPAEQRGTNFTPKKIRT